jgi:hypothetical protein
MQVDAAAGTTVQVDAVQLACTSSCRMCDQPLDTEFEEYNGDKFHWDCLARHDGLVSPDAPCPRSIDH